jgi:hypothetical protein
MSSGQVSEALRSGTLWQVILFPEPTNVQVPLYRRKEKSVD